MRTRLSPLWFILPLLLSLMVFVALSQDAGRARSQGAVTPSPLGPDAIVVPASDALALANALTAANFRAPGSSLHIFLEGGVYTFAEQGMGVIPALPTIASTVVLHGNDAVLRLYGDDLAPDQLRVLGSGNLTLKHLTLQVGAGGRAIVNEGTLRIEDSRIANDLGVPDYQLPDGGGIRNSGVLLITRTTFERNRLLTTNEPGGAIWNAGTLTVTCTRFLDGLASQGGAVYNAATGSASIIRSLFSGNQGNGGGAIFNAATQDLDATQNWWRGGFPTVNNLYAGVDTVSDRVQYTPVRDTDPTQNVPACAPVPAEPIPSIPGLALDATATPTPAENPTPTPDAQPQALFGPMSIIVPPDDLISFPTFTIASLEKLSLVGSASHLPPIDAIRLMQSETPTTEYAGALWSSSKQTLNVGFHVEFTFRVTRPLPEGGDGFAFVIQNSGASAVGIGGCSNGYNGIPGVFAIEFDLYWNNYLCPETHDPSDNHIGVMVGNHLHTDPSLVYDVPKTFVDFKDGQTHVVTIDYRPSQARIEVNIDNGRAAWGTNVNPTSLPLDGQNRSWIGFVAGQFNARANVDVLGWRFVQGDIPPTPTPVITCPWDGRLFSQEGQPWCGYEYDPQDAADYALTYAKHACPLFCRYNFPGSLSEARNCVGGTDCANFVSQSILAGGLPLNRDWYCAVNADGVCERGVPNWAGAIFREVGSRPPSDLELPGYLLYLGGTRFSCRYQPGEGPQTYVLDCPSVDLLSSFVGPYPSPFADPTAERTRNVESLGRALSNANIGQGDLIFTTVTGLQHVGIVVGWGPPVNTWEELRDFMVSGVELSSNRTETNSVPYVVDHGPQGIHSNSARLDRDFAERIGPGILAGAKPFYALRWGTTERSQGVWVNFGINYLGKNATEQLTHWGFISVPRLPNDFDLRIPYAAIKQYQDIGFSISDFHAFCPVGR